MASSSEGQHQYDRLSVHLSKSRVNDDYIIEAMVTNDHMGGMMLSALARCAYMVEAQIGLLQLAEAWTNHGLIGLHALLQDSNTIWGPESSPSVAV